MLNPIYTYISFYLPQLNCFQFSKWLNDSIWPIDGIRIITTTLGQCRPESNRNEEELPISQSSRTRASPSYGLVSYQGLSLRGSYLLVEMQSVYSTASADKPLSQKEEKNWIQMLKSVTWKICHTLQQYSSVIRSSIKCGWSHINLHQYKENHHWNESSSSQLGTNIVCVVQSAGGRGAAEYTDCTFVER